VSARVRAIHFSCAGAPNATKALAKRKKVRRAASGTALLAGAKYINNGPWKEPTLIADNTAGDVIDGEDLAVRRAAVKSGTTVVERNGAAFFSRAGKNLTMTLAPTAGLSQQLGIAPTT